MPISLSPLRPHGPFAGALSSETVSLVLCHSSRESPSRPCPRSASAWTSTWALLPDLPPPLPPPGLLPSIAHQPHEVKTLSPVRLCDPMDCSPPGASVQGILQARVLEWVAISYSRGFPQPRDRACISQLVGGFFTTSTTWAIPLLACLTLKKDPFTE